MNSRRQALVSGSVSAAISRDAPSGFRPSGAPFIIIFLLLVPLVSDFAFGNLINVKSGVKRMPPAQAFVGAWFYLETC